MLLAGADKVAINTAAVQRPEVIREAAERFGSQCMVVAIDARAVAETPRRWEVYVNGGSVSTGLDAVAWAQRAVDLGAGEILLTSIDQDGTQDGYELHLTRAVSDAVPVPVIASGGAGTSEHIRQVLTGGGAGASTAMLMRSCSRWISTGPPVTPGIAPVSSGPLRDRTLQRTVSGSRRISWTNSSSC